MKIYANVAVEFNSFDVASTFFTISFNWMTTSGIIAGGTKKKVTVPGGTLTPDSMNLAIVNAIKSAINASGLYTVQSADKIILFGGFTLIV